MSSSLLLDTHIVLWLDSGSERLHAETRALIDRCWLDEGEIFFSAVSAWEMAMLVDAERITLDTPLPTWIGRFLSRPGMSALPLAWSDAARAYELHGIDSRDPADRLLVAQAVGLACPLVTYDERIISFGRRFGARHGFRVAL
ncbi:MAG TPA: type II toxin-antitoxin system VapC family toxin [Caulobacteraceae bacterium]|nr:type II toxin-antitoxin system VapC family toxin [Caulobacteraceae bacterium]